MVELGAVADLDRESILALDNIRLDLPVAGVGSRCLAGLIDGFAVALLLVLWLLVCAALAIWLSGAWGVAVARFGGGLDREGIRLDGDGAVLSAMDASLSPRRARLGLDRGQRISACARGGLSPP